MYIYAYIDVYGCAFRCAQVYIHAYVDTFMWLETAL